MLLLRSTRIRRAPFFQILIAPERKNGTKKIKTQNKNLKRRRELHTMTMMMMMINFRAAMSNWSLASLSRHGTTKSKKKKKEKIPKTARLRLIALAAFLPRCAAASYRCCD